MSYDYFNNNTSTNQYLSHSHLQSDDIIDNLEQATINNTSGYTSQYQYRSHLESPQRPERYYKDF